jgi:hypothetical protein
MGADSTTLAIAAAERFVDRLAELPPLERDPGVPPLLHSDPYLSAWTNIEAAFGNTPAEDRSQLAMAAERFDGRIGALPLAPELRVAAHRAVRALLVRGRPGTAESLRFVYEPFETSVPLRSLGAG